MKKQKAEISPLPCGVVSVNKKPHGRVLVGIVDGNRMPAFGFDVKEFVPNHFRMVPFGSFGIFAASRQPIEVRVILDGQVVRETRLFPKEPPQGMFLDPMMKKLMSETPTPHYLSDTENGLPFTLGTYAAEKSLEDIIADQLLPGRLDPPPTMDMIDNGSLVLEELREDVDPVAHFAKLQAAQQAQEAAEEKPVDEIPTQDEVQLTDYLPLVNLDETQSDPDEQDHPEWKEGDDINEDADTYRQLAQIASVAKFEAMSVEQEPVVDEGAQEQEPDREEYGLMFDPRKRASSWAPSHGLLAVGVRFIQVPRDNEPLAKPDGFTYVLFQLNPWDLHLMARCQLMGRIVIPSREQMARVMHAEGFGGEIIQMPNVSCGHDEPRR